MSLVRSVVVYGAGAVGGVIAARLSLAGHDVTAVARGEHLDAIRANGLHLDTTDGVHVVRIQAVRTAADVDWSRAPLVVLAVKSHQTATALADLARHAPEETAVVCAQNGVANEQAALRDFANVYGVTVMLPAQHLEPGVVVQSCHPVPGVLDLGRYPEGLDETAERLCADLRSAGFESLPRPDIMAWKYRKLVANCVGDVRTVLPDEAASLAPQVRAEAEAAILAAAIPMVRAVDLEARGSLLRTRLTGPSPNSLGQSLARGLDTEIDFRAGEVIMTGRRVGVPTPANERVQRAVRGHVDPRDRR
ncbi:MAG TPA: 2-dehydropantoate 2-reductase [Marmoricola sp.]|nr:2-dehydropantoate 2-reductase [Marmoricola sp.]